MTRVGPNAEHIGSGDMPLALFFNKVITMDDDFFTIVCFLFTLYEYEHLVRTLIAFSRSSRYRFVTDCQKLCW